MITIFGVLSCHHVYVKAASETGHDFSQMQFHTLKSFPHLEEVRKCT